MLQQQEETSTVVDLKDVQIEVRDYLLHSRKKESLGVFSELVSEICCTAYQRN